MYKDWENCESQSHIKPWALVKLRPSNTQLACTVMDEHDNEEDWEFGGRVVCAPACPSASPVRPPCPPDKEISSILEHIRVYLRYF
jgi:hypothetical protein